MRDCSVLWILKKGVGSAGRRNGNSLSCKIFAAFRDDGVEIFDCWDDLFAKEQEESPLLKVIRFVKCQDWLFLSLQSFVKLFLADTSSKDGVILEVLP